MKAYKCESCEKSFSHAAYLKKHIHTIHDGQKNYKCEPCGKSYSEAATLKKHIHAVHKGKITSVILVVMLFLILAI